jgi:hypothetical protein
VDSFEVFEVDVEVFALVQLTSLFCNKMLRYWVMGS